jgi:hypothetical protein
VSNEHSSDLVIVQLGKAGRALAEAKTIQDTKQVLDIAAAAEIYAKRQQMSQEAIDYAHDIKVQALAQIGRMLKEMPKNEGQLRRGTEMEPRETTPTLADIGIDKKTSSLAQKLAEMAVKSPAKFEAVREGSNSIARAIKEVETNTIATLHTGDEESYTPSKYIEAARRVLGRIDLDPASNPVAQKTVKAEVFYTVDDDGLSKSWKGTVWMNPPYTALVINRFLEKLCTHYEAGDVAAAITLTNNNTDTSWFHKTAAIASAVCFTAGRINFTKPDGSASSPTNGQIFFYLGNDVDVFAGEFSAFGLVMVRA